MQFRDILKCLKKQAINYELGYHLQLLHSYYSKLRERDIILYIWSTHH